MPRETGIADTDERCEVAWAQSHRSIQPVQKIPDRC
jgi:hypothetical protein